MRRGDTSAQSGWAWGEGPPSVSTPPPRPPKKLGGITDPRVDEIHAELVEVFEKMQAESGTLGLRAEQSGAWALWRDAHPP